MAQRAKELRSLLMKVEEESEKAGLKLSIQTTKIMASGPITSWQIDGERVRDIFFFLIYFWICKITADGECFQEIERCLLRGRKAMTNLNSVLKSRDTTLLTKIYVVKAMVFHKKTLPIKDSWKKKYDQPRQHIKKQRH